MKTSLRRASAMVWAATAALVLALLLTAMQLIDAGRREAMSTLEERATLSVAAAESSLNRTLLSLDLQLTSFADVARASWQAQGGLDAGRANGALAALKDRQLIYNDAAILDADGRTLAASLSSSARNGFALPKGFAVRVFAQPVPQLQVSDPTISPSTTEPSVLLARPSSGGTTF